MTRPRTLTTALLAGLLLCSCTTGAADKGGGSGGVVSLTLASPDSPGRPSSRNVEYFAEQVHSTSGGRLRIEVDRTAADTASWDQVTAQRVIDGQVDLGVVPARAWDTFGVTTLQALQAPFLVTSDAALDAVVNDPVAGEMVAGLDELGVTGLGLFPEGLRHLASFGEPLLEPADFAGTSIRAPLSDLSWETLEALGATPLDLSNQEETTLMRQGALGGAETSAAYLSTFSTRGVLTGNLTPYAKATVLVANSEALEALSEDQRDMLRLAADETVAHAIEARPSDGEELAALCAEGYAVVAATAEQQAAMVAATRPVRDRLAADETTGPFLARITEIVESAGPPAPAVTCENATPVATSDDLWIFDGVWSFEVAVEDGVDAGLSEDEAAESLGVQTVTLDGGSFRWEWQSRRGEQTCEGTYSLGNGLLHFTGVPECGRRWEARPVFAGDRIIWTDVRSRVPDGPTGQLVRELLHGMPWQRIEAFPAAQPLPEGVYRWEITEDELLAAGVDPGDAYTNAGLSTFTVRDGRWLHHIDGPASEEDCGGPFEVRGSRIAFSVDDPPACGVADLVFSGRWEAIDGGIRFTSVLPADGLAVAFWSRPWLRIG